jgi:hypothetical protein
MSRYLARLKAMLAEKPLSDALTELTKASSVSFVSDQGSPVSGDEGSAAIRERAGTLSAENTPTRQTDRTDKGPSVSSVSDQGGHISLDGDISNDWRERVAPLLSRPCPNGVSMERWARACPGAERFAQQWAEKALSLGWTFEELFALRDPLANVSLQGAAWFIGDSTVTAVTVDAITLRTASGATQRLYRRSQQ